MNKAQAQEIVNQKVTELESLGVTSEVKDGTNLFIFVQDKDLSNIQKFQIERLGLGYDKYTKRYVFSQRWANEVSDNQRQDTEFKDLMSR